MTAEVVRDTIDLLASHQYFTIRLSSTNPEGNGSLKQPFNTTMLHCNQDFPSPASICFLNGRRLISTRQYPIFIPHGKEPHHRGCL